MQGSGSCGLSRRLASIRAPCVNGGIGLSCPAGAQCGPKSPLPAACWRIRCRRRISQPPGSEPSAFHRVLSKTASPSASQLVSTPASPEARFGLAPPGALLVPSSPFLTASTASSTSRFAGLLHPASDREVHRVSAPQRRMPAVTSALPHRCTPSRAFPFREAVHASPRGLAPLPFTDIRRRDFEALFRSEVRHSGSSWPNSTARCSPGLPRLEPHPTAFPSGMPR